MISGQKEKETTLSEMIDVANNALPVFTNDGTLAADVDIQRFLTGIAFHSPYTYE